MLFGIPHTGWWLCTYRINGAAGRTSNRTFTVVHCDTCTYTLYTFKIWICRIKYAPLYTQGGHYTQGGCSRTKHTTHDELFLLPDVSNLHQIRQVSVSCEDKQHSNFTHSRLNIHSQSRYW